MASKNSILPLIAITVMGTPYVAASVIAAHNDSSHNSTVVNFQSAVSISYQSHNICSGIILNKRWIITSANCVQKHHLSIVEWRISYGSANRNADERSNVAVEQIILHPKFNSISLVNNVALIKTQHDIDFNDNVEPVKLPTANTLEDESAYAIGWTITNEKVPLNILHFSLFYYFILQWHFSM